MESKTISIIIPNYNKAKFLDETFDSLLEQSYNNWEVLIVDDHSTDNSTEIIQYRKKQDPRFKYFSRYREPKGANTCRNIGLENAKGEYMIFLDSDDLLSSDCLKNRLEVMLNSPELDFAVFPGQSFLKKIGDQEKYWRTTPYNNHLAMFLKHELPWNITSPIWKTSFVKKHNGFKETYPRLQDVEFHTRVLLDSRVEYRVITNTKPDCYYRINPERMVQSYFELMLSFVKGTRYYLQDISSLIQIRTDADTLLKYLRGTIITILRQVLYHERKGNILEKEKRILVDILLDNDFTRSSLSKRHVRFLNMYSSGYSLGLSKLKGYNFLAKKLIVSI